MFKSNSLYDELIEMSISDGYYTLILLLKMLTMKFIMGIIYFKTLPYLFEVMMDWPLCC